MLNYVRQFFKFRVVLPSVISKRSLSPPLFCTPVSKTVNHFQDAVQKYKRKVSTGTFSRIFWIIHRNTVDLFLNYFLSDCIAGNHFAIPFEDTKTIFFSSDMEHSFPVICSKSELFSMFIFIFHFSETSGISSSIRQKSLSSIAVCKVGKLTNT